MMTHIRVMIVTGIMTRMIARPAAAPQPAAAGVAARRRLARRPGGRLAARLSDSVPGARRRPDNHDRRRLTGTAASVLPMRRLPTQARMVGRAAAQYADTPEARLGRRRRGGDGP
jgi:hypothetical protein